MAWTCYVVQRDAGDDVANVTAVWNEGQPDEESINCGKWKVENASRQPIKDFADAELARRQAVANRNEQLSSMLESFMNA